MQFHWRLFIALLVISIFVSGGAVYFWQQGVLMNDQVSIQQADEVNPVELQTVPAAEWRETVRYYCEQSGGAFINDNCDCPSEFGADMYEKPSGQCQTTYGGPGGELGQAMNACIGLHLQLDECLNK